jgi:GNAT superfamily N-acetyltransferase
MKNINILPFNPSLNRNLEIASLMNAYFDEIESPKSVSEIKNTLSKMNSNQQTIFLIASDNQIPIGFLFGNLGFGIQSGGPYFWLNDIYLDQRYRHRGVAQLMVYELEQRLLKDNIHYIAAMTDLKNQQSQKFFSKLKFDTTQIIWIDKSI